MRKAVILVLVLILFSRFAFPVLAQDPDVNHDGVVNVLDLTAIGINYGKNTSFGDVNNDGVVDLLDLVLVSRNFAPGTSVQSQFQPQAHEWVNNLGDRVEVKGLTQEFLFDGQRLVSAMEGMPISHPWYIEIEFQEGWKTWSSGRAKDGRVVPGEWLIVLGKELLRKYGAQVTFSHEFGHFLQAQIILPVWDGIDQCSCLQCEATELGRKWVPDGIIVQNPPVQEVYLLDCGECGRADCFKR